MEPRSRGEAIWRLGFYLLSAVMTALGLTDLSVGRLAHALGDFGVACLLLSLFPRFPLIRMLAQANEQPSARDALLAEAERLRRAQPWAARVSSGGWALMGLSLLLRLGGAQ